MTKEFSRSRVCAAIVPAIFFLGNAMLTAQGAGICFFPGADLYVGGHSETKCREMHTAGTNGQWLAEFPTRIVPYECLIAGHIYYFGKDTFTVESARQECAKNQGVLSHLDQTANSGSQWGSQEERPLAWEDAVAICQSKSMRLPTRAELWAAFRGGTVVSWTGQFYWSGEESEEDAGEKAYMLWIKAKNARGTEMWKYTKNYVRCRR